MSFFRLIRLRFLLLFTILLFPGSSYGQLELLEKFIKEQIDTSDYLPYIYNNALEYNLMIAAGKGYPTEVEKLIKRGADINAENNLGVTALILAVANNKPESVSVLLAYNPDLDKFTAYNENALLIAVKNDFFEIAEKLIRAGANINIGDRYNATPLHYASIYGYTELADMLIYYDADINYKTSDGSTPLHGTVWAGNFTIADILIQNGARIEEKDNEGFTPFLLASYFGDTLMMDMLYRKGANIFASTNKGYNALSLAIMSETSTGVEYLLKIEKSWDGTEKSVTDPYTIAAKYQRKDIVELLKKYNIPGKVRYEIDQVRLSASSRFLANDYYTGLSLSFKEPFLNAGFMAGLDTKLWYTRILMKYPEMSFYQYWNKGSLIYAGLFKGFNLSGLSKKVKTEFTASILAGYSFGNELKGTSVVPRNRFRVIPSVSLHWSYKNFVVTSGLEYIRSEFYHNGPLWFRIGAGYNYCFDNIRGRIKVPKWY